MLILTRKPGESIHIGGDIVVTLLGIQGAQARLGIKAPPAVDVYREEIKTRIQTENLQAEQAVLMHIDERIRQAATEPVYLTVVFKLPNAQAASALINRFPHGKYCLGTQGKVVGMTTGNAIELLAEASEIAAMSEAS